MDEAAVRLRAALELAFPTSDAELMLDVLIVVAALALRQNRQDFARRVASYVAGHSGAVEEMRQQAARMLKELKKYTNGSRQKDWSPEMVEDVTMAVLQES